eukprot:1162085-Pelagomonas_calceolata.AAC.4
MMGLSSLECLLETNSCLGVCELKSTKIKHYVTIVSATCECLRIRKTQDQNVPHASVSCGLFHPYCTSYDPEDEPKGRQLQRCKIRWGEGAAGLRSTNFKALVCENLISINVAICIHVILYLHCSNSWAWIGEAYNSRTSLHGFLPQHLAAEQKKTKRAGKTLPTAKKENEYHWLKRAVSPLLHKDKEQKRQARIWSTAGWQPVAAKPIVV